MFKNIFYVELGKISSGTWHLFVGHPKGADWWCQWDRKCDGIGCFRFVRDNLHRALRAGVDLHTFVGRLVKAYEADHGSQGHPQEVSDMKRLMRQNGNL